MQRETTPGIRYDNQTIKTHASFSIPKAKTPPHCAGCPSFIMTIYFYLYDPINIASDKRDTEEHCAYTSPTPNRSSLKIVTLLVLPPTPSKSSNIPMLWSGPSWAWRLSRLGFLGACCEFLGETLFLLSRQK